MMICKNNSQTSAISPSNTPKSNQHTVKSVTMSYEPQNNMTPNPINTTRQNSTNGNQPSEMKCFHDRCECISYSNYNIDTDSSGKLRSCSNCKHSWIFHGKLNCSLFIS